MVKEKKKQRRVGEEDMISNLPDELLCRILSELFTKDSIRTSVLSKRWRSLWLHVPVLDLDSKDFSGDEKDFIDFVDDFLDSNEELDLKRFSLIYQVYDHVDSIFDSWIDAAIRRRIRDLTVHNEVDEENIAVVVMPVSLYTCETLVNLTLDHLVLEGHKSFWLPCLKTMHLEKIRYCNDKILENLISSSESLQELTVIRVSDDYLDSVMVRSKSLKSLVIESLRYERLCSLPTLVIDAPKLEYMDLTDHFSETFVIHSIGPSAEVHIDVIFDVEYGYRLNPNDSSKITMIGNFLTGISIASYMAISAATMEVIRDYCSMEPLPQFANLRCLHISFLECSLKTLPYFLESCPNLHTLIVEFHPQQRVVTLADPIELSSVPRCFLSSLKFVHLKTEVTVTESSSRMKLAVYFMRKCVVLKELKLSESFGDIIKKIKRIPKRSQGCKIVMD